MAELEPGLQQQEQPETTLVQPSTDDCLDLDLESECLTCPSRPNHGECPFASGTPEWKNWYEHFGYELVRWSQLLSDNIERIGKNAKSIKWTALHLNGIETEKGPVNLTRISNVPVFNSEDEGITVAENCDIVTYDGTGILINRGKGVVINTGTGIVINFSNRTCTNTGDGILICFGKSILENSGAGYGIIKTCSGVAEEDRVVVNSAGGMVIKNVGYLLHLYNSQDEDPNCNQNEVSEGESDDISSGGMDAYHVGRKIDLQLSDKDEPDNTSSGGSDLDESDGESDSDSYGGSSDSDNENSDDETGGNHADASGVSETNENNTTLSAAGDESDGTNSLSNNSNSADEDESSDEVDNDDLSSVVDSESVDGLTDIELDDVDAVLVLNGTEEDAGLESPLHDVTGRDADAEADADADADADNVDDYNDEVSSLCNSCCSDVSNQEIASDFDDDEFAAVVMTADEDAENYFDNMNMMDDIIEAENEVDVEEDEAALSDNQNQSQPINDTTENNVVTNTDNESNSEGGCLDLDLDVQHDSQGSIIESNPNGMKKEDESNIYVRKL